MHRQVTADMLLVMTEPERDAPRVADLRNPTTRGGLARMIAYRTNALDGALVSGRRASSRSERLAEGVYSLPR